MSEKNVNSTRQQSKQQTAAPMIDFKQLWSWVVLYWQWFVLSVIACLFVSVIYLWVTPTTISVTGKMELIDKSKKGSGISAGMAMLNSLPMGLGSAIGGSFGGSLGINSEKEIITSTSLVRNVVKDLTLFTEYRFCKWGRKTLLYQDQPINVTLDQAHVEWLDSELPLTYHQIKLEIVKNDNGYSVETLLRENNDETTLPKQSFNSLPITIKTDAGLLTLTDNKLTEKQAKPYKNGYTLEVLIIPPTEMALDFVNRLSVGPPSKKIANILNITLQDENLVRGIDFVNQLVKDYNERANKEKNEEASKTDEFVNARLAKLDAELGSSDAAWENSKKNFQITEPEVDAQDVMAKKGVYESKLVEIGTELQLHDYLSEYVRDPNNLYELIPVGISGGMGDLSGNTSGNESASSNASLIAQHNTLVSQRKELLRSMSDKAPQIQRLTESIKELHPTLLTAMKRDRQNIIMKRNAVEREYSKYMGRVNTAPKMERVLTEIGRQREIKQGVYLLMLQQREEIAMELANTTDKGRFIDETSLNRGSNKPQKKMVLMAALLLGFILPIVVLYIYDRFKTKIDTIDELKKINPNSTLAAIPLNSEDDDIRLFRTNLLLKLKQENKVILFVSDKDGDGKTYLAKRLTDSLSSIGKKTMYFNADLRSSKASNVGQHPADFLASEDFVNQINDAKANNDYVIIDTPATKLYSDAAQIAPLADLTLYVVKAGSTEKSTIKNLKSSKFPELMFVLNAIDMTKKKNIMLLKEKAI